VYIFRSLQIHCILYTQLLYIIYTTAVLANHCTLLCVAGASQASTLEATRVYASGTTRDRVLSISS